MSSEFSESCPLIRKNQNNRMPILVENCAETHVMRRASVRASVYEIVEGEIESTSEYLLLILIFANVASLAATTMVLDADCVGDGCMRLGDEGSPYEPGFEAFEFFSVVVFTCEYVLRLWSCMEIPRYSASGPLWGRVYYATSFLLLVDFVSVAPYWFFMITGDESPNFTTAFRVFRLVRLLKADKYLNAFSLLDDVLDENSSLLIVSSFYAFLVWVLSAAALFMTESNSVNEDTALMFQSIPRALYPALMMITGNVPNVDYSIAGRIVVCFTSLCGVGVFAVPAAVLASGFMKAVEKNSSRHELSTR